jgi:succinyl-CoA synthetase beta subunit
MNLHEYQSKRIFAEYGEPVPAGRVEASEAEALTAAADLAGPLWVVKAQVHAGGRGKAGAWAEAAARDLPRGRAR